MIAKVRNKQEWEQIRDVSFLYLSMNNLSVNKDVARARQELLIELNSTKEQNWLR